MSSSIKYCYAQLGNRTGAGSLMTKSQNDPINQMLEMQNRAQESMKAFSEMQKSALEAMKSFAELQKPALEAMKSFAEMQHPTLEAMKSAKAAAGLLIQ